MTPEEHQTEFLRSLERAIIDAGGHPERFTRMDTTLAHLRDTLAQNGVRFTHEPSIPKPTPAQRAGFEEGDFAIINTYVKILRGTELFQGDLLQFMKDDGTTAPHWKILSSEDKNEEGTCCYVSLDRLTKLEPVKQNDASEPTPAEKAGIRVGDTILTKDGDVLRLKEDDGTSNPPWTQLSGAFPGLTRFVGLPEKNE